jgi:hypothetical protein
MKVTYYGQSCFLIETLGQKLLFDPFISPNPLQSEHAKTIVDTIEADYILLTHGHGDHVADAESIAKRCDATIISNYEIVGWYQAKGIKGHPMNLGGSKSFDFGTVKMVNAVHSSVLPDGTYAGNPGGTAHQRVYDTYHTPSNDKTVMGRQPVGNASVFTPMMNQTTSSSRSEMHTSYVGAPQTANQMMGPEQYKQTRTMNAYDEPSRMEPSMLDAFKKNPYTHSLQSAV